MQVSPENSIIRILDSLNLKNRNDDKGFGPCWVCELPAGPDSEHFMSNLPNSSHLGQIT